MSQPIIQVENLSKCYKLGVIGATSIREEFSRRWDRLRGFPHPDKSDFWALRDVSFDVQPGEVVGIIGRNGAGKSTLLKLLSRITEPTSGRARLRGRVASLLEVGTGFHPELTGRENIFLNGAILGMSRSEVRQKFDEIVDFAEVEKFIDTPVKRYSSGMYVRLAFAVAAHLEPEMLIVDEVLAVGDSQFQAKCLGKMSSVASDGRTILFVSHQMSAVQRLCNRCVLLEEGQLSSVGDTDKIITQYLENMNRASVQKSKGIIQNVHCSKIYRYNEPLQIEAQVNIPDGINKPHYRITIYADTGEAVINTGSHLYPEALTHRPGKAQIKLEILDNLLLPGTYRLNIAVCNGESGMDVLERRKNVTSFQIIGDSPYPANLWPAAGSLAVRQRWSSRPI